MTTEQAKSELMQIYMSLSEEKKKALDVAFKAMEQAQNCDQCEVGNPCLYCKHEFKVQADGEYISKDAVIEWLKDIDMIKTSGQEKKAREQLTKLPSVAIPQDHDGCKDCRYQDKGEDELPCCECQQNYKDKWEKAPQWIHTEECDEEFPYRCSKCNLPSRSNGHRYCPNCGSYMYGHLRKFRMR